MSEQVSAIEPQRYDYEADYQQGPVEGRISKVNTFSGWQEGNAFMGTVDFYEVSQNTGNTEIV